MPEQNRKPDPAHFIGPEQWEHFFRDFKAPLFVEDVTEVRQSLNNLREQGINDFPAWLDAHPEFLGQVLSLLKIVDVSDFAVEWAGASSREELLDSFDRMVLPETLPALKSIVVDLYEGRRNHTSETQYMTLDGRHIYTLNMALLPGPDDNPALLFLSNTEITHLKLAQLDLVKSQDRYSRLVQAAQDVILTHGLGGEITFINQTGLEMSGFTLDQVHGQDLSFLLPERKPGESRRRSLAVLSESRGRSLYETVLRTREGRELPVEVNATVIPGTSHLDGEPLVLAMIRDITDRKEAETQQRELEIQLKSIQKLESLGMLAGGIAHDFNNLLVTIMGNTELLQSGKPSARELQESLAVISEAATQAADLCRQMQAYAGQTVAHLELEDLGDILVNMSRLLQATVTSRVKLNIQVQPDLPRVKVDAGQIRQVIMNLVTNAAESLEQGAGEITLRVGFRKFDEKELSQGQHPSLLYAGTYIFCEVEDNGTGMAAETIQRLFDPFFTTKTSSRGLGMSAALGVIQGHQGGFLVRSEAGKGSALSFLLPVPKESGGRKKSGRKSKKAPDDLHLALKGKTILTVDEDASVRSVAEGFLRRLGCRVLSAGSGLDAMRIFSDRHSEIDAALLDLTMQGMDGVETCRRMRAVNPGLPVIFASGFSIEDVKQKAGQDLEFSFAPKPFRMAQLRAILAEVLKPDENE